MTEMAGGTVQGSCPGALRGGGCDTHGLVWDPRPFLGFRDTYLMIFTSLTNL